MHRRFSKMWNENDLFAQKKKLRRVRSHKGNRQKEFFAERILIHFAKYHCDGSLKWPSVMAFHFERLCGHFFL